MKVMTIKQMEKEKGRCEWCGALLLMQPGPYHKEDGKEFCNPTCAGVYRVTKEPRTKEIIGG